MEEDSAVEASEANGGGEMIRKVQNASAENISTTTVALERQISVFSKNMPVRVLNEEQKQQGEKQEAVDDEPGGGEE